QAAFQLTVDRASFLIAAKPVVITRKVRLVAEPENPIKGQAGGAPHARRRHLFEHLCCVGHVVDNLRATLESVPTVRDESGELIPGAHEETTALPGIARGDTLVCHRAATIPHGFRSGDRSLQIATYDANARGMASLDGWKKLSMRPSVRRSRLLRYGL